jgi:excinuclease ABC subunit C
VTLPSGDRTLRERLPLEPAAWTPGESGGRLEGTLPSSAGVYVFRDGQGRVLYVGKSRRLARRVRDHLRQRDPKDAFLASRAGRLEFFPTRNEREALLLEANLVREHQPRYNVLLKDDKSFPYLRVTTDERFPRLVFTRRPDRRRKGVLFGPYVNAREARRLARLLSESFQLRRCVRLPSKACLYFHLKMCSAPCIGKVDAVQYAHQVESALAVLRGETREALEDLRTEMSRAAERLDYERAAVLRDALEGLRSLRDRQSVVDGSTDRADFIACALPRDGGPRKATVGLLHLRDGRVVGGEPHRLQLPPGGPGTREEVLAAFLSQYYVGRQDLPQEIWTDVDPRKLQDRIDPLTPPHTVRLRRATTGRPRALWELARRMAEAHLWDRVSGESRREVLPRLMSLLRLPRLPRRIEGIDISLFQGDEAVGSLVSFHNGLPDKSEYRRFRIRTVEGTDDFAMVREVVDRRFRRLLSEEGPRPDLLLIDGGPGQVRSAWKALQDLGIDDVPVVGLAKKQEQLFWPDRSGPLELDPNDEALLLLRHVRDEAHRFAVSYHRRRREMRLRHEKERGDGPAPPAPEPVGETVRADD